MPEHNTPVGSAFTEVMPVSKVELSECNPQEQVSTTFDLGVLGTCSLHADSITNSDATVPSNRKSLKQLSAEGFFRCGNRNGSCSYLTQLPTQFDAHMREEHANECAFPCVHCGSVEMTCDSLLQHLEEHLTLQCLLLYCAESTCDFNSFSPEDVLQHIVNSHSTLSRFTCWCCSTSFSSIHSFVTHVKQNVLQVVRCPHCSAKDIDRKRILAHISSSHPTSGRMVKIFKILLCQERTLAAWQVQNSEHAQLQVRSDVNITSTTSIRNHAPVPLNVSPLVHIPNVKQDTDFIDLAVTGSDCETPELMDNISDDVIIIDLDKDGNQMSTDNNTDTGADRIEFPVNWTTEKLELRRNDIPIVTEGENNLDKVYERQVIDCRWKQSTEVMVESSVVLEERNKRNGPGEKEREIKQNKKECSEGVATASCVNHSKKQFEDEHERCIEVRREEIDQDESFEEQNEYIQGWCQNSLVPGAPSYSNTTLKLNISHNTEYLSHINEQSEVDMLESEFERTDLGCAESEFAGEYVHACNTTSNAENAAEKQESKQVLKTVLQKHADHSVANAQVREAFPNAGQKVKEHTKISFLSASQLSGRSRTSGTDCISKSDYASELGEPSEQPEISVSQKSSPCEENITDPPTSASAGISSLLPSEDNVDTRAEMEYRCPYCVTICKSCDKFHAHLCYHLHYQCYKCCRCTFMGFSKGAVMNHISRIHPRETDFPEILRIVKKDKEAKLLKLIANCYVPISEPYTDRRMKAMEKAALQNKVKSTRKLKALVPRKKLTKIKHASVAVHSSTQSGNEKTLLMCPYCRKQRKTQAAVENEIRCHIHYKPFSCPHCTEKPFESSSHHRVVHHILKTHPEMHSYVTETRIHKKEEQLKVLLQKAISISKVSTVQKSRTTVKRKYGIHKFGSKVRPQKHTGKEPSASSNSSSNVQVAFTSSIRTKDCFHIVSHEKEITYTCKFCDYTFSTKTDIYNQELARKRMWKHVFNKHKKKSTTGVKK